MPELEQNLDIFASIKAVKNFFEGEHFSITDAIDTKARNVLVSGQRQDDCDYFDHCYVDQGGGGMSGDDFHGIVYFHIGDGAYICADY